MQHDLVLPRALRGSVFSTSRTDEPQALFQEINATLREIQSRHDNNIGDVREEVGNLTASLSAKDRFGKPVGTRS